MFRENLTKYEEVMFCMYSMLLYLTHTICIGIVLICNSIVLMKISVFLGYL